MNKYAEKYLNADATMLFSISNYMTAYIVDAKVKTAVNIPINTTYRDININGNYNIYYDVVYKDDDNYIDKNKNDDIFRSVIEQPNKKSILLIDQKYISETKTIVAFYLLYGGTRGFVGNDIDKYGYIKYPSSFSTLDPIKNKCVAYQTIGRVFDPILDSLNILHN